MNELVTIPKVIMRNKSTIVLTVFQVALTLAVLINTYASIDGYQKMIDNGMGMDQKQIITVEIESINRPTDVTPEYVLDFYRDHATQNMNAIGAISGVESVAAIDSFPLSDNARVNQIRLTRDTEASTQITVYTGDENVIDTLGLQIMAGRKFQQNDSQWVMDSKMASRQPIIIISSALAGLLFGEENPLGKQVYIDGQALTVIAITDVLPGLHPLWANSKYSAIVPGKPAVVKRRFLVKVESDTLVNQVIGDIEASLSSEIQNSRYIISISTMQEIKENTLQTASSTLKILAFVSILLLIVTAFGTYGQTSFLVSKRRKEIGIKRAIGATKLEVMMYYLVENSYVAAVGIFFGLALTYMLNFVLVNGLGATKISTEIVLPGILFIWVVGILSALIPAWQASKVPPALATRLT